MRYRYSATRHGASGLTANAHERIADEFNETAGPAGQAARTRSSEGYET